MNPGPQDWTVDAELLERWRDGDVKAGDLLYQRHCGAVIRFFRNKTRGGVEIEELVQQTFLRLIEGRERIREGITLRAFVLGISRNVLLESLRARTEERRLDPRVDALADSQQGMSSMFTRRQEQRLVLEGLRRLPLDQQILLELFYWEGLKSYEIARVLGTPEVPDSTMRSRIAQARALLKARIAEIGTSSKLIVSTVGDLDEWARSIHSSQFRTKT